MKNFGKRFLTVLVLGLAFVLPTQAFADMGIQLRVPYQGVTNTTNLSSGSTGTGVLLSFGLDSGTQVGYLNEMVNFTDNTVQGSYSVNAIRLSKDVVGDLFFVALDLGSASSGTNAVRGTLADIVFGSRLMGKKDKITSFFNVEMMYRVFNPGASMVAGGAATNYGGVFVNLGAGLTF